MGLRKSCSQGCPNHQQQVRSKNPISQIMSSWILSSRMCLLISDVISDVRRTDPCFQTDEDDFLICWRFSICTCFLKLQRVELSWSPYIFLKVSKMIKNKTMVTTLLLDKTMVHFHTGEHDLSLSHTQTHSHLSASCVSVSQV